MNRPNPKIKKKISSKHHLNPPSKIIVPFSKKYEEPKKITNFLSSKKN